MKNIMKLFNIFWRITKVKLKKLKSGFSCDRKNLQESDIKCLKNCCTLRAQTYRILNVYKTFSKRPGRFLNALCTFNVYILCPGWYLKREKKNLCVFFFFERFHKSLSTSKPSWLFTRYFEEILIPSIYQFFVYYDLS